jgi:hypothetical protein
MGINAEPEAGALAGQAAKMNGFAAIVSKRAFG